MSDDKSVTGPNDDEELGHGGVEVPMDDASTLPLDQDANADGDDADGDIPDNVIPS